MEIKKTTTTEITLGLNDLKTILGEYLNLDPDTITMREITTTSIIPGGDPHDADYVEIFSGIKITHEE